MPPKSKRPADGQVGRGEEAAVLSGKRANIYTNPRQRATILRTLSNDDGHFCGLEVVR